MNVTYIINKLPSKVLKNKPPYELLFDRNLHLGSYNTIHVLGIRKRKKSIDQIISLKKGGDLVFFLGSHQYKKRYYVYDLKEKRWTFQELYSLWNANTLFHDTHEQPQSLALWNCFSSPIIWPTLVSCEQPSTPKTNSILPEPSVDETPLIENENQEDLSNQTIIENSEKHNPHSNPIPMQHHRPEHYLKVLAIMK